MLCSKNSLAALPQSINAYLTKALDLVKYWILTKFPFIFLWKQCGGSLLLVLVCCFTTAAQLLSSRMEIQNYDLRTDGLTD